MDSVNSTEVFTEIHDNSYYSDVIVLLKAEHIHLLKEQHSETKKTIQNGVILLKYKVYSSLQIASEFSMIGVPDFIDETGGMARYCCKTVIKFATLPPPQVLRNVWMIQ